MKREEYIETLVINGHMINVGLDDYGQTYFLEYIDEDGDLLIDCVGAYCSDYKGYAEMLFENPENCEHYGVCKNNECDHEGMKTYCHKCKYSPAVIARNKRWLEKYGLEYPNLPEEKSGKV